MSKQFFDVAEQEITVGCWIAQTFSLGRCPALKISKVIAFTDKDKIRVQGFERCNYNWVDGKRVDVVTWTRCSVSTVTYPERQAVIHAIPASLQQYIDDTFNGDPTGPETKEL